MEMFLPFIAPILLLVLIVLRLSNKINVPIGASTGLMMFVGIVLTALSVNLITDALSKATPPIRCGMPQSAAIMLGLLISIAIVPIIGTIGGLIWYFKNKQQKVQANP